MSAEVVTLFPGGTVSRDQVAAIHQLESHLNEAVQQAKSAQVPQGFIVALLHAVAMRETQVLV